MLKVRLKILLKLIGKELVARMLESDPQQRYTAQEALNHPWFENDISRTSMLSSALENMKKYHNT